LINVQSLEPVAFSFNWHPGATGWQERQHRQQQQQQAAAAAAAGALFHSAPALAVAIH
jgi:hypothetical protein